MMLLFTWGQDYVKPGDTLHGFAPSETMQGLGFEYGDHILRINEEAPFDVRDVNADLMLHSVTSITVKHPNGNTETIAIPEGTDMTLFKNGERGMAPRMQYTTVDIPEKKSAAGDAGIKTGDQIIAIDGGKVEYWDEVASNLKRGLKEVKDAYPDSVHATQVTVLRNGSELSFGVVSQEGLLGVGVYAGLETLLEIEIRVEQLCEVIPEVPEDVYLLFAVPDESKHLDVVREVLVTEVSRLKGERLEFHDCCNLKPRPVILHKIGKTADSPYFQHTC
jgi:hypothetical protein